MMVKVTVGKKRAKNLKLGAGSVAGDVFNSLGLKPDMHIAVRNGAFVPLDEPLSDGDEVRILAVASGG